MQRSITINCHVIQVIEIMHYKTHKQWPLFQENLGKSVSESYGHSEFWWDKRRWGFGMAVASAGQTAPYSRQISTPTPYHSIFTSQCSSCVKALKTVCIQITSYDVMCKHNNTTLAASDWWRFVSNAFNLSCDCMEIRFNLTCAGKQSMISPQ